MAALATIWKETGSVKWTAFSVIYSLVMVYTVTYMVIHITGLVW
jgi:Fe2+ transport system protein B